MTFMQISNGHPTTLISPLVSHLMTFILSLRKDDETWFKTCRATIEHVQIKPHGKKKSSNDLNTDQEKENNFVLNGNRYSMVTTLR